MDNRSANRDGRGAVMSVFVQLPPADYSRTAFAAFSPQRARFDINDARAMMWMSRLAYETDAPSTIAQIGPLWGFQPVQHVRVQALTLDSRAIVGVRPDATVVALAGTDPALARNLITDAGIRLTQANTHEGFQAAADAVWPQIEAHIRASTPPLFFAGHSLGAAMAVLAAEKAFDLGLAPAAVYTFGMPRTGGPAFAARYNAKLGDRTYRLVHGNDTVPRIPDEIADAGVLGALLSPIRFQHVGRMLACESGGRFDQSIPLTAMDGNDPRFVPGARDDLRHRLSAVLAGQLLAPAGPGILGPLYALLPFAIRDHLPDRYCRALAEA